MKYLFSIKETLFGIQEIIVIQISEDIFKHVQITETNNEYASFLEQAGLTDAEVHELTPNVWYDFPKGVK